MPLVFHLVLHQGNKRTDYKGKAFLEHLGHLKTDALSASGGQQGKGVAALENGVDNLPLQGAE